MMKCVKRLSIFVLCLLTAFAVLLGSAQGASASGNLWYDKYVGLENSIGDLSYQSIYSSTLGWGESYIMQSYIDMYNLTKDTAWLDKITLHTDTMIANADDVDGDGYLGWETYTYSVVQISNTGFETAASGDSTLPDKWTRFQSTSTTAYRTTSSKYAGSYSAVIKTNGTTWQKLYQPMAGYIPNTTYTLRLYARTNGSAAKGQAYVYDRTAGAILGTINIDTTDWTFFSVSFTSPSAAGHQLEVWLGHQDYRVTGGEVYFDEVKVSGNFPYIVHDGMICYPIAQFVKLVNDNPGLQAAYQTKADSYRSFIENEIVPRWQGSTYLGNCWVNSSGTEGYYIYPPNFESYTAGTMGDITPYNMQLAFVRVLLTMYDINGNSAYLDKVQKSTNYWKNRLTANGTAYSWKYASDLTNIEDASHGMLDIGHATEMFKHGLVFSGTDMEKFTDTLTEVMWNGSATSPAVNSTVDGSGNYTTYTRSLAGWLELSQFDPRVWTIAAEQYRSYTPASTTDLLVLSEIMKWDPVKLVNQGFELKSSSDGTLPARWTRWQSTSSTAYLDSANKASGSYGLAIKANGTLWQKLYQDITGWKPSTAYVVTFDGNTDGTAAGGSIVIRDETTLAVLATYDFTNTSWQTMSFTFTTPAASTDVIRVYLGNKSYTVTNGKAYYDNIVIKQSGDTW